MTLKYFNVKNGLTTGNITLTSANSNIEANTFIGNLSVTSEANLGNVSNLTIIGGNNGEFLQTDGAGNLTWATVSSSKIANGNSNVDIPTGNGNVTISVAGNSNVLTITGTGIDIAGGIGVGGNIIPNANITWDLGSNSNRFKDLYLANSTIYLGNVTLSANGNDFIVNANLNGSNANFTGQVTIGNLVTNSPISGNSANFSGNVIAENITANSNISANNISSTELLTAGNGLQVTTGQVDILAGNLNVTGNVNVTGNLNYSNVTDLVVGDPLIYIGSNNTGDSVDLGIVASYNNGNYVHTGLARNAADDYWTFYDGVVAEPTTLIDWANATYPTVKLGNLIGTANANIGGYANVVGNANVGNLGTAGIITANGTITAGAVTYANTDGTNGQVLTTYGNGITYWSTAAGGSSSNIANGNSNVSIPAANGNIEMSVAGNANIFVVTGTGANVNGTLNITNNTFIRNNGSNTSFLTLATPSGGSSGQRGMSFGIYSNGTTTLQSTANANTYYSMDADGFGYHTWYVRGSEFMILGNSGSRVNMVGIGNSTYILGDGTVAIGANAQAWALGGAAVSIGKLSIAGLNSVSIGVNARTATNQSNSTIIGSNAISTVNNAIILNATGSNLFGNTANSFTVKPVRNANTANILYYNESTGEITYDVAAGGGGSNIANGLSTVTIPAANGNIVISRNGTANTIFATTQIFTDATRIYFANSTSAANYIENTGEVFRVIANGTMIDLKGADNNVAIGIGASATANGIAIGRNANSLVEGNSVAIGWGATTRDNSVALGPNAVASWKYSVAIGSQSFANLTNNGIAFGTLAQVSANNNAYAIGTSSKVSANNGIAFGTSANASAVAAIAIGNAAVANSQDTTVVGNTASATANGATAFGSRAASSADYTVAIGVAAAPSGDSAIAVGYNAKTAGANSISIGTIAGGTAPNANATYNINIGWYSGFQNRYTNIIAIGSYAAFYSGRSGNNTIYIGNSAGYDAGDGVAGNNVVAIGYYAGNPGSNNDSVVIGTYAGYQAGRPTNGITLSTGSNLIALGSNSGQRANGNYVIAFGSNAGFSANSNTISIGTGTGAYGAANSISIGVNAGASNVGANAILIGANAGVGNATAANVIVLNATGANLEATTANTFIVKPVRQANTSNVLYYNSTTGEISYDAAAGGTSSNIANGNSNVSIATSGGNVTTSVAGNANIVVVTGTGVNVAGTFNATGNANVGNLGTGGLITATGNVSGGNLTTGGAVDATGNVSGGNLTTGGLITATGNVSGGNLTTGGVLSVTGNANVGNLGTTALVVTGTSNLNAVGNVIITGGSNGQVLTTNGSGNLSWTTISTSTISNGNSNISIPAANGNVTISAEGNANIFIVTGTGVNVSGTLNATGNANVGNIGANNALFTLVTGTLTTAAQPNITSVGTLSSLTATGNVSGGNVTTAGQLVSSITTGTAPLVVSSTTVVPNLYVERANLADNINVADVTTGTYYPVLANAATGNVSESSNANLTFNAATGRLSVTGLTTTSNIIVGAVTYANTDGTNGQVLTTYGNGITYWSTVSGGGGGASISNGTSNVNIATSGGNVTTSVAGNANIQVVTGTGVNVAGTFNATGNGTFANVSGGNLVSANFVTGTLTTAAQPNITSIGTLSSIVVSGNANVGNLNASGRVRGVENIIVDGGGSEGGQLILGWTGITGITGQANSTWNMDVDNSNNYRLFYQNSTGGTGVSLTAYSANSNVQVNSSLLVTGQVVAGTVTYANTDGTAGQVLTTYGNGITYWSTVSGGGSSSNISNGTSNVNIATSGGNITFGIGGAADEVVFTSTGANVNGYLTVTGQLTSTVSSGTAPFVVTSTTQVANLSVATAGSATTAGTVTTAAQPNITSTGSLTNTQTSSLGVGTAASGTTGEIRATADITAYYSDDRLKTKLGKIENALDKVANLTGFYYEANELAITLGYTKKREVGLSAQEMLGQLPEVVAPAPIDDKYYTLKYERVIPLIVEAIKDLKNEVDGLKKKLLG